MLSKWFGVAYRYIGITTKPKTNWEMNTKENKGRPVRWIWYIKLNPTCAYIWIPKCFVNSALRFLGHKTKREK